MKKLILIAIAVFSFVCAYSQKNLTGKERQQVVSKISKAAMSMNTMHCEFTQTKNMKMLKNKMQSKGVMYYKKNNKLRWQYTSPYNYIFLLNGNKVKIESTKGSNNINVQKNKMFKQITNVILGCVTGASLRSTSDFKLEIYKTGNTYFARLYPQKKELKQIYKKIEIHFNSSLTMVNSVMMEEATGDTTTVLLKNVKINTKIDDKMFNIN